MVGVRSHLIPITDWVDTNADKDSRAGAFYRLGN